MGISSIWNIASMLHCMWNEWNRGACQVDHSHSLIQGSWGFRGDEKRVSLVSRALTFTCFETQSVFCGSGVREGIIMSHIPKKGGEDSTVASAADEVF